MFTILANASFDCAMMMTSTFNPDSYSRFLDGVVKMTCTKSSETLYCDAMLLLICLIRTSKSADEVLLEFVSLTCKKPLSRTPLV